MEKQYKKYFLASNSCEGFISHFADCYSKEDGWYAVIIKGGAGSGKSSLMRYMASYAESRGLSVELCPCSSDPKSLDAVIIPQIKLVFLDGTNPHTVEPQYAGVREEIVNTGDFWDTAKLLKTKEQIVTLSDQNKKLQRAVSGYMRAAHSLFSHNLKLAQGFTDTAKAETYAAKLANRYIPINKKSRGKEDIRFLSGITPEGVVSYPKTATSFYENIIVVSDKYWSASSAIMKRIHDIALLRGVDIVTVKNPFLPSQIIDHILIPSLSVAFVTEYDYIRFETDARRIHSRRFYDVSVLKGVRNKLLFNKRMINELLTAACETSKNAKFVHDCLEKYYVDAMNFKALSEFAPKIAKKYIG